MSELQTDPALLKLLKEAAKRKITEEEKRKQRISFIMSGISRGSSVTRRDVEKALKAE